MDPVTTPTLPRDLPLALPADPVFLQALLVVLFLVHILFVNLLVGGSLLTVISEVLGRRRADFDRLAREIAQTITVNKSLAVVLGVGPLLAINVLYTVFFYSANALTGTAWIMMVPLICVAFLVAYAHKYSWDRLAGAKGWHIALGALASLLFLAIPLVFLANINLMLFPERWHQVQGFWSAVSLPNVLPRFLHFLLASVAVTSLFLLAYFHRPSFRFPEKFEDLSLAQVRRMFYRLALGATCSQLMAGPLVLMSLPSVGLSWPLYAVLGVGVVLGIGAIIVMAQEVALPAAAFGPRFVTVVVLITGTAFCMGYGRHLYRESAVTEHRRLMTERSVEFAWASAGAQWRQLRGVPVEAGSLGERVFKGTCSSCHALDRVLVGPPIQEIARLYAGNPDGIARWTENPGQKRENFPRMPAFRLGEEKLRAVAEYLLELADEQADS